MHLNWTQKKQVQLKDLYPELNREEYAQIEFNLKRYLDLVWRIYKRQGSENPGLLTENPSPANVKWSAG